MQVFFNFRTHYHTCADLRFRFHRMSNLAILITLILMTAKIQKKIDSPLLSIRHGGKSPNLNPWHAQKSMTKGGGGQLMHFLFILCNS